VRDNYNGWRHNAGDQPSLIRIFLEYASNGARTTEMKMKQSGNKTVFYFSRRTLEIKH